MTQNKQQEILNELDTLLNSIYNGDINPEDLKLEEIVADYVLSWFAYYQGDEDTEKMEKLYNKLINEEHKETKDAVYNQDMLEYVDGVIDYCWVVAGLLYFQGHKLNDIALELSLILTETFIPEDLALTALLEIAYSNWTKSLAKRDKNDPEGKEGKIIKGENFKRPNLKRVFEFFKNK